MAPSLEGECLFYIRLLYVCSSTKPREIPNNVCLLTEHAQLYSQPGNQLRELGGKGIRLPGPGHVVRLPQLQQLLS